MSIIKRFFSKQKPNAGQSLTNPENELLASCSRQGITTTFLYQRNIWDVYTNTVMPEKSINWWNEFTVKADTYSCQLNSRPDKRILMIRFIGMHRDKRSDTYAILDLETKIFTDEMPDGVLIDLTGLEGYTAEETWSEPMPRILFCGSVPVAVVSNKKIHDEIQFAISEVSTDRKEKRGYEERLFENFDKAWEFLFSNIHKSSPEIN